MMSFLISCRSTNPADPSNGTHAASSWDFAQAGHARARRGPFPALPLHRAGTARTGRVIHRSSTPVGEATETHRIIHRWAKVGAQRIVGSGRPEAALRPTARSAGGQRAGGPGRRPAPKAHTAGAPAHLS